ncbi:MAG: hypothetical protein HY728_04180 [Candidatus Rokubacteria bacterium]|nr:hypothetical protein [Candidatus Rokubacteria bacterium]
MLRRGLATTVVLLGLAAWATVATALRPGDAAPEIGGSSWVNSPPLTLGALRGRVVALEFWTYG